MTETHTRIFEHWNQLPINKDTACQFKWTWSTLFLNFGTTTSCHRCRHWPLTVDNVEDFHNVPGKLADREKMLQGQWPGNGCEYCRMVEDVGGISERQSYIKDQPYLPPEMSINPSATSVTPRLLEVYFSNLCNQACTYCSAKFSSVIDAENKRHGEITHSDLEVYRHFDNPDYAIMREKFWNWMDRHGQSLYKFQILGGEPLYQPEFERCIEWFNQNPCPELEWHVFSNLKHKTERLAEQLDRIEQLITDKKLKSFQIVASMDCWGAEAEYARYGMSLDQWERNFLLLMNRPWVQLQVHSTITSLTTPTMWELYQNIIRWEDNKIMPWGMPKYVHYSWNTIQDPKWMNPKVFGDYCVPELDRLLATLATRDMRFQRDISYLTGIRTQLSAAQPNHYEMYRFRAHLDELDQRRKLNWRGIYPALSDYLEQQLKDYQFVSRRDKL
jgi:hypothetical protein